MGDALVVGSITMGANRSQVFAIPNPDARRHVLATGATGSGKTVTLKCIAESMICAAIPVVAVDVLGDLSGLAVPAHRDNLALLGMEPSTTNLSTQERADVNAVGERYEHNVYARVLTPCSDIAERMALSPLPMRPSNYVHIAETDRDYLVLQADTAAANLMNRLGLGVKTARLGGGPDMVRGIVTDVLMAAWDENEDLHGIEGLQRFLGLLEAWGAPPLPEEAMSKFRKGVAGLMVGAEALWHRGTQLDFSQLLAAPPGKTALVVINIAHLARDQHPWVVSQVIYALSNWAAAQPGLPEDAPPRVGLLIDELAGESGGNAILPPGNFKSLSGEGIRKVLRQGRHWGLSLLAGTQSPRDVDGKSFSNFTNRFVGKLATAKDIAISVEGAKVDDRQYNFLADKMFLSDQSLRRKHQT